MLTGNKSKQGITRQGWASGKRDWRKQQTNPRKKHWSLNMLFTCYLCILIFICWRQNFLSLPFQRPIDRFTKLCIASTVQQGSNLGCTGIPSTLLINSKAERGRGDNLSSEELSIARSTCLPETAVSAMRKSQHRLGMLQLHTETAQSQQPTSRPQKIRWKENSSVSEESMQDFLLFRAIKLPRSKHLLNRHAGFKPTKMLYTFFSFHLIYLLWVFWI